MRKILLKRLLYEVFEDLVFLDAQVNRLEGWLPNQTAVLAQGLQKQCQSIQNRLFAQQEELVKMFDEATSDEEQARAYFESELLEVRQDISKLAQTVYRVHHGKLPAELELFLTNLNLDKIQAGTRQQIAVIPSPNEAETERIADPFLQTDDVIVESLPWLSVCNALRWVDVLGTFAERFCQTSHQLQSLLMDMHLTETSEIVGSLLKLRLMGPAYYAFSALQALKTDNMYALVVLEPLLFQGLNRFGLVNKDLVILHQAVEKHRQTYDRDMLKDVSERWLRRDEERERLLQVIEKVIPDGAAFNEKCYYRAQLLEDRLSNGILVSAVPMLANPNQLLDDLAGLDNQPDRNGIYHLIHQLAETPATPLEIINAAWLHKLDHSRGWLSKALMMPADLGWLEIKQRILDMNVILLKSIETSEVSRTLLYAESPEVVGSV